MSDLDNEAFDHYDDAAHREPAPGQPHRLRERVLTEHVPVRFPASAVEAVRELAEADGFSTSAWIRHTVDQAVANRTRPAAGKSKSGAQVAVERLQRDLAELAAILERNESR
jgi:hypothetical protein